MARPPKATQPPALAELPSRQFYTLKEAAAELNRLYGRTDIDENYILQLASMGKIAVQFRFLRLEDMYILPFPKFHVDEEMQKKVDLIENLLIAHQSYWMWFLELPSYVANELIFFGSTSSEYIFFENVYFVDVSLFANSLNELNGYIDFGVISYNESDVTKDKIVKETFGDIDENTHIYSNEGGLKGVKYSYEKFIDTMGFYSQHKFDFEIFKEELYVLGQDINLLKNGKTRNINRSTLKSKRSEINSAVDMHLLDKERPTNQRRQVLAALRHMAQCNSGQPYKDAEVLSAYAATNGLPMPAKSDTIAKHIYPDQNIIDSD